MGTVQPAFEETVLGLPYRSPPSSPRSLKLEAAGVSHAKFRQQFFEDSWTGLAGNAVEQQISGLESQLVLWQFNGRKFWPEDPEPRIVVKADEAEVFRALKPHFLGGLQESDGHEVVCHVDAIRPMREQDMSAAIAGLGPIIPLNDQRRLVSQPVGFQRIVESLPSRLAIADFHRATHQTDARSPRPREVAYRLVSALIVIGDDGVFGDLGECAHHQDDGNVHFLNHLSEGRGDVADRLGEKDSVYPL